MKTGFVTSAIVLTALTACSGPEVACSCVPNMVFNIAVAPTGSCDSARLANLVVLVRSDNGIDTVAAERDTLCPWFFPISASMDIRTVDLVESTRTIASYPVQSTLHENGGCCGDYVESRVVIPGGVDTVKGLVLR